MKTVSIPLHRLVTVIGVMALGVACADRPDPVAPVRAAPDNRPDQVILVAGTVAEVSAGGMQDGTYTHSCALRLDGTIACWGTNGFYESTPPEGKFRKLSVGGRHACAISDEGAVICWGSKTQGESTPPEGVFVEISAGEHYTCGIREDGTAACWGWDKFGQATPPGGSFTKISARRTVTCGIRPDATVSCWGSNGFGQATAPAGAFAEISVGAVAACGIRRDGAHECWGGIRPAPEFWTPPASKLVQVSFGYGNICGILPDQTLACWNSPKLANVPSGTFVTVSTGGTHACAVSTEGEVVCWGELYLNRWAIPPTETFKQIGTGYTHVCGIKIDDTLHCWGSNHVFSATPPSGTFSQVSAGWDFNCGVRTSGEVACWGQNNYGQSTPPGGAFVQADAGGSHACGIHPDRTVECWGGDFNGQATPPGGTFSQVSAGDRHTCAIETDGAVACWGNNDWGQSTPPTGSFSQVSAGGYHTCALGTDGTVTCWGYNVQGQATPPSGTFTQVDVGSFATCGMRTDGRVECWGDQVQWYPPPTGVFTQISVGQITSCGLELDQSIVCWGRYAISENVNSPPTAVLVAPASAVEGDNLILDAAASLDPDGDPLTYDWDFGDGVSGSGAIVSHTYADDGIYVATLTVTDPAGLSATESASVTVNNAAPTLAAVAGPMDPMVLGSSADISADFTDAGVLDTHTAQIDWGDNSASPAVVTESSGSGSVSGAHVYAAPGVYPVTVTLTDDDGGVSIGGFEYVVVYSAAAGFTTGGGIFNSPAGALASDPSLTGLAQFGFQATYQNGATVPTGNTQFRFRAARFEFESTSYQWLVVAGPTAKYKGEGTVNGVAGYGFMITARDGQAPGGGGVDRFRLKVWTLATGVVVYDNQPGASEDSDAATVLVGGQIQVHQ